MKTSMQINARKHYGKFKQMKHIRGGVDNHAGEVGTVCSSCSMPNTATTSGFQKIRPLANYPCTFWWYWREKTLMPRWSRSNRWRVGRILPL